MDSEQTLKLMDKLSELGERMARVEEMLRQQIIASNSINEVLDKHEDRINSLEANRDNIQGWKQVAVALIALVGFIGTISGIINK